MSGAEPTGVLASFRSIRKIWEERDSKKDGTKEAVTKTNPQLPPPSPSSKSHQDPSADPFHLYGFSLQEEAGSGSTNIQIKKVARGGMADLAGVIFPGDKVLEVNGIDVRDWPLDKVSMAISLDPSQLKTDLQVYPLMSEERCGLLLRLSLQRIGFEDCIKVELDGRPKGKAAGEQQGAVESDPPRNQGMPHEETMTANNLSEREQPMDDDENSEDRTSTIRNYKTRIQELSYELEEAHVSTAQHSKKLEELFRLSSQKDETIKELKDTVRSLHLKLEQASTNVLPDSEQTAYKSEDNAKIAELMSENNKLRQELERLSLHDRQVDDLPEVREYKLQLIEKSAKLQELESECASLKRNNVIQAVELQELHDHISGMEKQTQALQNQLFPPLPPLGIIQEVPFDDLLEEDDKLRAMILADEALGKAQQEITMLKQNENQRKELEYLYMIAQDEISQLRNEMQLYQSSQHRSEPSEALIHELQTLRMQNSALTEEMNTAKEQISYLEDQASEIERLKASNLTLEYSKRKLEELLEIGQQNYDMYASSRRAKKMIGQGVHDIKELESVMQEIAEVEGMLVALIQEKLSPADEANLGESEEALQRQDVQPCLSLCSDRLKKLVESLKHKVEASWTPGSDQSSPSERGPHGAAPPVKHHPIESALEIEQLLVQIHDLHMENDRIKTLLEQKSQAYVESQSSYSSCSLPPLLTWDVCRLAAAQNHLQAVMAKYEGSNPSSPLVLSPQSPSDALYMPQELQERFTKFDRQVKELKKQLEAERARRIQLEESSAANASEPSAATEYSARMFESVVFEKRVLTEELDELREEKRFLERCLTDARIEAGRLETENKELSQGLHDCQMSLAKMEGKWKAAQSRITSLEKEIQMKNTEVFSVTEEVKRMRQNVIQNDSQAELENKTLRDELKFYKEENVTLKNEIQECNQKLADHRKEIEQWYTNFDDNYNKCKDDLKEKEEELSRVAKEINELKEAINAKEAAMGQKEHKMGILADQLKTQKERTLKAEARASQAEEQLASIFSEQSNDFRSMDELSSRYKELKEHSLELQAELSSKQIELAVTIEKKDSAISSLQTMKSKLDKSMEQIEVLNNYIRSIHGNMELVNVPPHHLHENTMPNNLATWSPEPATRRTTMM
ncbi:hypothetical protein GUITHDRAFT_110387 [Guillardia theta CCMP2712]|uniref:PDZ domain-containing protein n=1 Tax=Guillardia theta (strain CCMP2712) TaxID=905079 RepID=L1J5F8_GUITC|nr:hypothetical protein GUITHDRAFT_110387 [Guillardia theta CCMP2712]EKX43582.1 hypothetical protein GUITHDRAFT_110387 [Guillardia theta CCMP2712]|eukprot:XP_005830562.1 hypothetical protein GUITHDRAFT_110387 [Guillardia theta CCMP2712]